MLICKPYSVSFLKSKMRCKAILNSKMLLGSFNVIYLMCGMVLLILGFFLLCDSPRILLSRLLTSASNELPQPPFYYAALAIVGAGLFMTTSGAIGCWATYSRGYCVLTFYFLMVLTAIISQGAACVIVVAWPGCIGLQGARGGAVGALQSSYGIPGQEQFTAAMDLAQTIFQCCGMTDGKNYDTSLWQLRRLGPRDLIVPLTCCVQNSDSISYLDPKPINETICQELLPEHYVALRHRQGCLTKVEIWYQQQYIGFLAIVLILCLIEFGVLFSVVYSCMRLKKQRNESGSFMIKPINNKINENLYQSKNGISERNPADSYIYPDSFYSPRSKNPQSYTTKHDIA